MIKEILRLHGTEFAEAFFYVLIGIAVIWLIMIFVSAFQRPGK